MRDHLPEIPTPQPYVPPRGNDGKFARVPRPTGAPVGNMNGSRDPWRTYWRRRALKKEDRWALRLVEDYIPGLIADKGGPDNVSYAEQRVMETAAVSRVCWALAMAAGSYKDVSRFVALEVKCLTKLGLHRRAKDIDPVDAFRGVVARANEEPA